MQEGISYLASAELPAVIVNVMRGAPGLGGIHPSQADYNQSVKGGGHGDYHLIVLAPSSVQELVDHTMLAFELAEKYRTPVMVFGDAMMGQMMEPVLLPPAVSGAVDRPWATTGAAGRAPNTIHTLYLPAPDLSRHVQHLFAKYRDIEGQEKRFEQYMADDAEILIVAFGIMAGSLARPWKKPAHRASKPGSFDPYPSGLFPRKL
jgi:2-oxoglutarate ferredoxin oxidoreductase subunit alpha